MRSGGRGYPGRRLFLLWRDVARGDVGAGAEEMALHLLREVVARFLVREIEPVLVHQHLLVLEPLLPRFLGHGFEQALAELAGVRQEIQALRLAAELDALYHSGHGEILLDRRL